MKKPENFNAGATVKKSTSLDLAAAVDGIFTNSKPSVVSTPDPIVVNNPPKTETKIEQTNPEEKEKKEKFLVSMAKGERANFKAFCAIKNISMNHFVMCAMDYFKEDLESGKVTISQHSYKRQ